MAHPDHRPDHLRPDHRRRGGAPLEGNTPQSRHAAQVSAAQTVVAISAKLNRAVDPRIARIASLPDDLRAARDSGPRVSEDRARTA